MVTRGSQMAIYLAAAARALVMPCREPGYAYAWEVFEVAGARVIGIPCRRPGVDVARRTSCPAVVLPGDALHVTPHHQYPTTVTLVRAGACDCWRSPAATSWPSLRMITTTSTASRRPILPLASRTDDEVAVIYIGSLSKRFAGCAPWLRIRQAGYSSANDQTP